MNARPKRLTRDGLPRDGRDWTETDWSDLHNAIEAAKRRIAARHKPTPPADAPPHDKKNSPDMY